MHGRLNGRTAIIVGVSSGMGRATARLFAAEGASVALAARREPELRELAREIDGERALVCPTDVEDPDQVERLIARTLERFGKIDDLIYVTGTNIPDRSLERLTNETWDMMLRVNLTGAFYCTKSVLPAMRAQGWGLIVYVSSACVPLPDTSGVSYQASKHGLTGLAYGTFKEEKKNGVRTSIIFPGLTDTPLVLKRPVKTPDEVLAQALQPEDVAEACLYIASAHPRTYVPELTLLPAGLA